jgi:hypothetical protein
MLTATLALLLAAAAPAAPARAERHADLLHSDVPLWGTESGLLWPRWFDEEDGSFGCANRLSGGDWRYDEPRRGRDGEEDDPTWLRLTNPAVFHCAMPVSQAREREQLDSRDGDPSFLVELGTISSGGAPLELWLVQLGARPGSSYLLLARRPTEGIIKSFDVLQRKCPPGRTRRGPAIDVWVTDYCAINSPREMKQLARRMAALPPLGRLTFVGPVEDD